MPPPNLAAQFSLDRLEDVPLIMIDFVSFHSEEKRSVDNVYFDLIDAITRFLALGGPT